MIYGGAWVNGLAIVDWEAQRIQDPPRLTNDYLVKVTYQDRHGQEHHIESYLEHDFEDGALILMSKVFAWAGEMIPASRGEKPVDVSYRGQKITTRKESP